MIHPTAIVHPGANLDFSVEVGAFSVIGDGVNIDAGTKIGTHCNISGPCDIGRDNVIFQFASIGEAPQDLSYDGEPTRLVLGDRNTIREFVTLNRGTEKGGGETRIGNDNLIMAYCHVAHDCVVGNKTVFSNAASLAGHVVVGDHAILGGFTGVHQFVHIGEFAFTGFHSAVSQDVPPFCLASGNLASVRGINRIGLKRHGFDDADIKGLQKILFGFRNAKIRQEYLLNLAETSLSPSQRRLVDFIKHSTRGVSLKD